MFSRQKNLVTRFTVKSSGEVNIKLDLRLLCPACKYQTLIKKECTVTIDKNLSMVRKKVLSLLDVVYECETCRKPLQRACRGRCNLTLLEIL